MKISDLLEQTSDEEELVLIIRGEFKYHFKEFLEQVGKKAGGGAGVTLKAEDGDGEFANCEIDGDGADRITIK